MGITSLDLQGGHGDDVLAFGVAGANRRGDLLPGSDVLDLQDFRRVWKLKSLGDLPHHLLGGSDDENPPKRLFA